ncbi:hypothetical protein GGX14DRAFT_403677 [Mycena pura]|uniref:Uncharacterized protein n=1 Tax=Mycena pura TaxID=153505 RepID=A0AAD6Y2G1_9AGAR|nr:hypothetical protein GGX14DRAFT_403677 [Mycena pura]
MHCTLGRLKTLVRAVAQDCVKERQVRGLGGQTGMRMSGVQEQRADRQVPAYRATGTRGRACAGEATVHESSTGMRRMSAMGAGEWDVCKRLKRVVVWALDRTGVGAMGRRQAQEVGKLWGQKIRRAGLQSGHGQLGMQEMRVAQ